MKKRKNSGKSLKKNVNYSKDSPKSKSFAKEISSKRLIGVKIIVLVLLLYALYSLVMVILYIFSIFVDSPLRDYIISGTVNNESRDYFISIYGQARADNFFLLIGIFGSLITLILDFWFSWGLWKRKNWARITVSTFSIIFFVISLIDFFYAGYNGSAQIIYMVFYAIIPIYLLFNSEVKKFFLRSKT